MIIIDKRYQNLFIEVLIKEKFQNFYYLSSFFLEF